MLKKRGILFLFILFNIHVNAQSIGFDYNIIEFECNKKLIIEYSIKNKTNNTISFFNCIYPNLIVKDEFYFQLFIHSDIDTNNIHPSINTSFQRIEDDKSPECFIEIEPQGIYRIKINLYEFYNIKSIVKDINRFYINNYFLIQYYIKNNDLIITRIFNDDIVFIDNDKCLIKKLLPKTF